MKGTLLGRQRRCRVEALEPNRYFSVVPGSINLEEATELEQDNIEFQVWHCCYAASRESQIGWAECSGEGVLQAYRTKFLPSMATETAVFIQQQRLYGYARK